MKKEKPRIGQKNGAKELAKELTQLRRKPLPKVLLEIAEESYKQKDQKSPLKRSAKIKSDLGI